MFGADGTAGKGQQAEAQQAAAQRKQLIFELNRSGQYLQMKEQLKAAMLRIVKEQYHKSGSMAREEMQASLLLHHMASLPCKPPTMPALLCKAGA